MFRKTNNQDPQLSKYASEAEHALGRQLLLLDQVANRNQIEDPLTRSDARKDIRFRGDAYANRGFYTDDPRRDAFISYMRGERVDTSRASAGPNVRVVGPVHVLEMQGAYQQASPESGRPAEVRFQMAADLGSGAIKLVQQTNKPGVKKPLVEKLEGVEAWQRAMPYVENLAAVLEAKDPALGLPEVLPMPPTMLLDVHADELDPIFQEIDRQNHPQDYPPRQ